MQRYKQRTNAEGQAVMRFKQCNTLTFSKNALGRCEDALAR